MTQPAHITHFYSHDLEIRAVCNQNYTATIELFNRIQLRVILCIVPGDVRAEDDLVQVRLWYGHGGRG